MPKKEKGRNVYLDLFRFFLAFMIICIHLTDKEYAFFPLYRLAVPMFFMLSGYFLYSVDVPRREKSPWDFFGVRQSIC